MLLMKVMSKQDGTWALGDFGFCVERISGRLRPSSKVRMSFETCALELLEGSSFHNERVDIWAVVVRILYRALGLLVVDMPGSSHDER